MTGLIIAVVILYLLIIGLGVLVWACIDYVSQETDMIKKIIANSDKDAQRYHDEIHARFDSQSQRLSDAEDEMKQLKDRNNKLAVELIRLNNSYTVSKKYWDAMVSSHSILLSKESDNDSE